ncbi:amino acid transporter heavy chain SLC3A1 [Parasteatoda tepidariorum]|uniref:amino acid transporter heavy chain SLC3A1 n=1 Tax=Parasteatoda tepidariorum TaxID=114398 RepID=UPI001C718EDE|nr:neutral and basic amino acid transport protein rBAT [Parasteatoda tepidariorum]
MDKSNEEGACNGDQHDTEVVDTMDEESSAKEKLTGDKVKFTSVNLDTGKNGEAKVDIQMSQSAVGMGKDELMKYANEPFWVRLRLILFILFWIAWFVMLVGAVVIIIMAPRCPPPPKVEWFQKDALYQVEVETFKDSDGNGIGDFKGIIEKLDYFKKQKISALMLSAFYKGDTNGGVVNHTEVDSNFGTLAEFEELVTKLKENDIRLVVDFIPNHSSDKHPWFVASVENQEPYSDFYIWADSPSEVADKNKLPNNWPSVEGGSAWEWNDNRQQFYLHTFGKDKPDLNLRSPLVQQELKEIVKFWLGKGIDGLKVVAASHLVEDSSLRDEAMGVENPPPNVEYKDFNHVYTLNQPENVGYLAEWKEIISDFATSSGIFKVLFAEISGSLSSAVAYYGNETHRIVDLSYNKHFTEISQNPTGIELKKHLDENGKIPAWAWPASLVGGKDVKRLASRIGDELVDAMHMIATIALGTPIFYNGDELGIPNYVPKGGELSTSQTVMLWNNQTYAGFSSVTPKYPVHVNYETMNIDSQENSKQSHLKVLQKLLSLRGQPALSFGDEEYPLVTEEIFSMMRVRKGSPGYLVAINLGSNSTVINFSGKSKHLPEMARVEIKSTAITDGLLADGEHPKVSLNNIPLGSKQSVVFSFVPVFN